MFRFILLFNFFFLCSISIYCNLYQPFKKLLLLPPFIARFIFFVVVAFLCFFLMHISWNQQQQQKLQKIFFLDSHLVLLLLLPFFSFSNRFLLCVIWLDICALATTKNEIKKNSLSVIY